MTTPKSDVTTAHLAKAALEHSDFMASLFVMGMLADQGLVSAMMAATIPVLGSVLRSGRSTRDIQALEAALVDVSKFDSELGKQAREILALRHEFSRLAGRLVDVETAAARLEASAVDRDFLEREIRSVVRALA